MSKIEILAPVGSEEMLRAAVFSGADAVYLGFSGFNARTGAGNFDADSLKEAVRFCHARGVAVHVALNTTVYVRFPYKIHSSGFQGIKNPQVQGRYQDHRDRVDGKQLL